MVLRHALCVKGRVLNLLPIVQKGSVPGALADLVATAFNHGVFILGDGLFAVCAVADLDEGVSYLAGICEGVVETLAALVGHWMGGVAD